LQTGFQNRDWALKDRGLSAQTPQTSLSAQGPWIERSIQFQASVTLLSFNSFFSHSLQDRPWSNIFQSKTVKTNESILKGMGREKNLHRFIRKYFWMEE
jgi:hypothetical protein